jgi:hypothetical protein
MKERKGSIYMKPHIDLHNIVQRREREREIFRRSYPFPLMSKGERNMRRERKKV